MKKNLLLLFILISITAITNAQQSELLGTWQLYKVIAGGETYDNLKAIYIFEEGGILKAARSAQGESFEVGSWKYKKSQNLLTMTSSLDKDFNGKATISKLTKNELIYEKDKANLYFKKITTSAIKPKIKSTGAADTIQRLSFTLADFFDDNDEYLYYDDEEKLPWQDLGNMLFSLVNVNQLVYKYSLLDENTNTFKDETLIAEVSSNPEEATLSIDYIFIGFDRNNLPEDTAMPVNSEYNYPLFPEEDNTFRVSGSEQISIAAGTFDCTVIELVGSFDTARKLWMINDKPGVYAKIIIDKPGDFGQYAIFELQEIKTTE